MREPPQPVSRSCVNPEQLIETVETLRLRGIGFRSLTEALDTTTAQGRLVFHMFGALAEFERSLIRERTQGSRMSLQGATHAVALVAEPARQQRALVWKWPLRSVPMRTCSC